MDREKTGRIARKDGDTGRKIGDREVEKMGGKERRKIGRGRQKRRAERGKKIDKDG